MMYLLTEHQHAQVMAALELPSLKTVSMLTQRDTVLAMLKAIEPVEPIACVYNSNQYMRHEFIDDKIPEGSMPLYTPTKD
jgi:uncharacterized Fe-S radical SAM superfamily protein PflX